MTITTNAAGRAAMAALNPVNPGTFQIQVQAAFQGQTAAAAITQTNVMTAAQAATASAAGAGGAGGGAGGGGLSGLAIGGIVGGVAVAGAAVAVTQIEGDGDDEASIDPAVSAAAGTYTLTQINGAGLPGLTALSPPNSCPVVTDSGTIALTAKPQVFDMQERSRTQCSIGSNTSFASSNAGDWSLQGTTITFTIRGSGTFNLGPGTLNGSTLSFAFDAPHSETGKPAFRVTSTWTK